MLSKNAQPMIFIGASTGGIDAVKQILVQMPADSPPIVIVQHLPDIFTGAFAKRMDALCAVSVKEAEHNDKLNSGCAYVAPGHSHVTLARSVHGFVLHLDKSRHLIAIARLWIDGSAPSRALPELIVSACC